MSGGEAEIAGSHHPGAFHGIWLARKTSRAGCEFWNDGILSRQISGAMNDEPLADLWMSRSFSESPGVGVVRSTDLSLNRL